MATMIEIWKKIITYPTQNIITNEKTKGKLIWTDREIDKE